MVDDLTVFPDGFLLEGTPFSFDVVRTLQAYKTFENKDEAD